MSKMLGNVFKMTLFFEKLLDTMYNYFENG